MMKDADALDSQPEMTKCAMVSQFSPDIGDELIDPPLTLDSIPRPTLASLTSKFYERLGQSSLGSGQLLVRVLACSLSPRDVKVMLGTAIHLKPKELPFVPGTDICGVVVAMDKNVTGFKVGETVVGNTGRIPENGMSEYALLSVKRTTLKPPAIDALSAASCHTAAAALQAAKNIESGDRVLILGGSGGVGSAAIQLAKLNGAAFVAVTSTQTELVKRCGADLVINYTQENWWELQDLMLDPVDVIIDTVGENFEKADYVLKSGYRRGRYIAITPEDDPKYSDQSSWFRAVKSSTLVHIRAPITAMSPWLAKFKKVQCTRMAEEIKEVLDLIESEKLVVLLHPSSPFPFTEYGVKDAFRVMSSKRAHGKVVVQIAEE